MCKFYFWFREESNLLHCLSKSFCFFACVIVQFISVAVNGTQDHQVLKRALKFTMASPRARLVLSLKYLGRRETNPHLTFCTMDVLRVEWPWDTSAVRSGEDTSVPLLQYFCGEYHALGDWDTHLFLFTFTLLTLNDITLCETIYTSLLLLTLYYAFSATEV